MKPRVLADGSLAVSPFRLRNQAAPLKLARYPSSPAHFRPFRLRNQAAPLKHLSFAGVKRHCFNIPPEKSGGSVEA